MQRIDQRPTDYRDVFTRLLRRTQDADTRAHGLKIYGPGEGTGVTVDGQLRVLGAEWAASVDRGIAAATDEVTEAAERLEATEARLAEAQTRIDDAGALLDQLDAQAVTATEEFAAVRETLATDRAALDATAADLAELKPRLGNVETSISSSDARAAAAEAAAATAVADATAARATADSLQAKLDAALVTSPGLLADPSFEQPDAWQPAYGSVIQEDARAASGRRVWYAPPASTTGYATAHTYTRAATAAVVAGRKYRITARVLVEATPDQDIIRMIYRSGDPLAYAGAANGPRLSSQEMAPGQWALLQWDWEAPSTVTCSMGIQVSYHSVGLAVDEFQVVDITEQADLALQIANARRAAEEAADAAKTAAADAGQALTTARGKATIWNYTTEPQGSGAAVGDLWQQWSSFPGGVVVGQWVWGGSRWVPQQVGHQVVASTDLGKATVGELDGIYIKGHSIAAGSLAVGMGSNALADAGFASTTMTDARVAGSQGSWEVVRTGATPYLTHAATTAAVAMRYNGMAAAGAIPTVGRQQWRITVPVNPGGRTARVNVRWFNAEGTSYYTSASAYVTGTVPTEISAVWQAPATAVGFLVDVYSPTAATASAVQVLAGATVRSLAEAVHIADGAITAPKVNAKDVAGALGQFITVEAENVRVDNKLAARVFSAVDAAAVNSFVQNKLVVGPEGVLQVLGEAIVNDINIRGQLRGRDAILKGTLDVEQLNVTKDMAAEIGSFMTVETKRLIVTEDALLQHVTAIEGIVTPKVDALETRTQDLLAQKANIADLAAGNLMVSGNFRSGGVGRPGVVIPQNYTTAFGMEQLGVWLTPDGKAPSLGSTMGMTAGMWLDNASNTVASTNKSTLHIRGQGGKGVTVWGDLILQANGTNPAYIKSAPNTNVELIASKNFMGAGESVYWAARNYDLTLEAYDQGAVKVNSKGTGVSTYVALGPAEFSSYKTTTLRGVTGLVLQSNGNIALRKTNGDTYRQSWSGGGLLDLKVGSSSGVLYTDSSSARYKTDIRTMHADDAWLDKRTVYYRDRTAVETAAAVQARQAAGDLTPITAEEADLLAAADREMPGRLAEEMATIDSPQVIYGADGQVESYDYSRDGTMLVPHVRNHRDHLAEHDAQFAAMAEQIASLEARLEALEGES